MVRAGQSSECSIRTGLATCERSSSDNCNGLTYYQRTYGMFIVSQPVQNRASRDEENEKRFHVQCPHHHFLGNVWFAEDPPFSRETGVSSTG